MSEDVTLTVSSVAIRRNESKLVVKPVTSKIEEELQRSILSKAALIEKEDKKNKK